MALVHPLYPGCTGNILHVCQARFVHLLLLRLFMNVCVRVLRARHRKKEFPAFINSCPAHLLCAFNSEGLHFLRATESRDTLFSFSYADIYRWGGSATEFSVILWDADGQDTGDAAMFTAQVWKGNIVANFLVAVITASLGGLARRRPTWHLSSLTTSTRYKLLRKSERDADCCQAALRAKLIPLGDLVSLRCVALRCVALRCVALRAGQSMGSES